MVGHSGVCHSQQHEENDWRHLPGIALPRLSLITSLLALSVRLKFPLNVSNVQVPWFLSSVLRFCPHSQSQRTPGNDLEKMFIEQDNFALIRSTDGLEEKGIWGGGAYGSVELCLFVQFTPTHARTVV